MMYTLQVIYHKLYSRFTAQGFCQIARDNFRTYS